MSDVFGLINQWIASHQALIVAVGLPLLTTLVAALISFLTNQANLRAQSKQRKLEIEMQLCRFRQDWINGLRDDLAQFSAIALMIEESDENVELEASAHEVIAKMRMRMNPDDPENQALALAIKTMLNEHLTKEEKLLRSAMPENEKEDEHEHIAHVGQRILKREWERLKSDLRRVEETSK